jgi:hypothetical protein
MPPIEPTDIETEGAEAPSLRDALSSAFEADIAEPVEEAPELEPVEPLEGETQEQADARARDEKTGQFTKAPKKPAEKAPAKPVAKAAPKVPTVEVKPVPKPVVPGAKPVVPTSAQPAEMKAPQAWREPAKQVWAQLPEAARVEVLKREKEITAQLATFGEDRKYAQTMKQAFAPFEAQIRAEGSTPERAIGNLMNTALALRTAPPAHKAALVADMINTYGVPLEHLVAALEGKQPPPGQRQAPPQVDPAAIAKQVQDNLMKQLGTQREQAIAAKVQGELDTFLQDKAMHGLDGTDYGDDIRELMADIIERAVARKSTITLDKAYILAAREHPEVSKVLERQEQAAKAAKANASTQRARAAASSVRSSPATQPVNTGRGTSLRDSLEQAVDQLDG